MVNYYVLTFFYGIYKVKQKKHDSLKIEFELFYCAVKMLMLAE